MELTDMMPEALICSSWLDPYEREIEALWWEFVQLNSNLFVLEKVSAFPFDLFQPILSPFWRLVTASLFETSVMIVWRLVDRDRRVLSLENLKDDIRSKLSKDVFRSQFDSILEEIDFEGTISDTRSCVQKLRHNRLAHFSRGWIMSAAGAQMTGRSISLPELQALRDALNAIFDLFCFGYRKGILPLDYDPQVQHPTGSPWLTDVETLLDSVARGSALLNMPEREPHAWPYFREQLSVSRLVILNRYRVKFGLPEV